MPLSSPKPSRLSVAILLVAVSLVAGCATRLAYDSADFLVARYVDDYVTFDADQQAEFDWRLDAVMAWHRSRELPAYADWLRGVAGALGRPAGVTPADVAAWRRDLAGFWGQAAERLRPELVAIGASLDDVQVAELVSRMAEDHADLVERYEDRTADARLERRVRSMERFLERWTGRLSRAQKAEVEAWARRIRPTTELWLENRAGWARELADALAARSDADALDAAVGRLFVAPETRWNDEYRQTLDHNMAITEAFLAGFLNDLAPRQRARARDRLTGLAEDLEALAADP